MATVSKGKYDNLEGELAQKRKIIPYQDLKRGVIETFVIGGMVSSGEGAHLVMSETLGLGKKADGELKVLYSGVLMPLQTGLDITKVVLIETAPMIDFLSLIRDETTKKEVRDRRDGLGKDLTYEVIPGFLDPLKDSPNVKSVIVYPLLVGTVNTWRTYDFDFADKIMKGIKKHETDEKIRMLIEQLDIPVNEAQIRRN